MIYTEDFELYYSLIIYLKKAHIPFISVEPEARKLSPATHQRKHGNNDKVNIAISGINAPLLQGVVLTGPSDKVPFVCRECQQVIVDGCDETEIRKAVSRAILTAKGKKAYSNIVIGIDPGRIIGFAVLGDGTILEEREIRSLAELYEAVIKTLEIYPCHSCLVRIGHGAPTVRNRIINRLLPIGIRIDIVDEHDTTVGYRYPNAKAAVTIARRKHRTLGRCYSEQAIQPTVGEIKDIKRRSRIKSGGRVTISDKLARKVIAGEIDMEEAIALMASHSGREEKGE